MTPAGIAPEGQARPLKEARERRDIGAADDNVVIARLRPSLLARMKTWKILRDCRLKGDGVHHAMLGIARLHNLALAG